MKISMLFGKLQPQKKDVVFACLLVAGVYLAAASFELAEHLTVWFRDYEFLQLDELPMVLFSAAAAAVWFSNRRMNEINLEMRLRIDAEQAALNSQAMYRLLFEEGLSGNFVADMEGRLVLCNQSFRLMSGMTGKADSFDLGRALGAQWLELQARVQLSGWLDLPELAVAHLNGAPWIVMARLACREKLDGSGKEIHGYFIDITEQHLAEKELGQLLDENKSLVRHAMQVQEEERRHLARDIHDDMGQYLTAIRLDAAALSRDSTSAEGIHASRIIAHAEHIQLAIKGLIRKLRPAALDAHGLIEALYQLMREWKLQNPDITCHVRLDENCKHLPEHISIVAYRFAQEGLTNIARHAEAKNVTITLTQSTQQQANMIRMEVVDDGVGIHQSRIRHGFGLIGMRERIEAAGGMLAIENGKTGGARISAQIPYTPKLITGTYYGA